MAIVETHAHLYSEDETRYPPAAHPHRPPPGTGTAEHLERMCAELGITHVVAVQTFSFYAYDNRLMVDTVAARASWMRGVCNLPSDGPDSPQELVRLATGAVRGYRLEFPAGGGPFYHPGAVAMCRQARERGLVVNIHARGTAHLADAHRLLSEFPEVTFCLDHCGYLELDRPRLLAGVLALARHRNLHAKISFYAERSAALAELGRQVVATFGPDRCMWGGNFPAELWHPRLSYADHLGFLRDEICRTAAEREAILEGTPLRVWFSGAR